MKFNSAVLIAIYLHIYPPVTRQHQTLLNDPHTFHCNDYCVLGGIRTCLKVSSDPMFLWISLNSCPLNLLFVHSLQTEIIIVKCLIQGRTNV